MFLSLPATDDSYQPPDDLIEALMHAHADNPAERRSEPFVQYLEYKVGATSLQTLVGMIRLSLPSDKVTEKMGFRMLVAVLKLISKQVAGRLG